MAIEIKRIYAQAADTDGQRILVDRLWPRGVSKEKAALDDWMKDLAPSADLREWFAHRPDRYEMFKTRFRQELDSDPVKQQDIQKLLDLSKKGTVTLLYGAKNETMNQAVVLQEYLQEKR